MNLIPGVDLVPNLYWYLAVGAILFCIGLYGALAKRNAVAILMCIELMFNAVNLTFVALARYVQPAAQRMSGIQSANVELTGQVFAIFVITVAAAEAAVGLAIILMLYRRRRTINTDEISLLRY